MSELFERLRREAAEKEAAEQKAAELKASRLAAAKRTADLQAAFQLAAEQDSEQCEGPCAEQDSEQGIATQNAPKEDKNKKFKGNLNAAVQEIFQEMSKDYCVKDPHIIDDNSYFDPEGASFVYVRGTIEKITSFDKSEPMERAVGKLTLQNNHCKCRPFSAVTFKSGPFEVSGNVPIHKQTRLFDPKDLVLVVLTWIAPQYNNRYGPPKNSLQ